MVRVSMAAGSSIFRLVHIPTRPLLSPVSEIYGVMPRVCAGAPERAVCGSAWGLDPFFLKTEKTNWETSTNKTESQGENKMENDNIKCTVKAFTETQMQHIQASRHSLMSLDCWGAALSWHPEFMSALWMQAGKQQTASQQSGCWSWTVIRAQP